MTLKQIESYILYFLPKIIIEPLKEYHERQKIEVIKKRFKRIKISKEEIIAIMEQLHLDNDVFLHSSITSIGKISGGTKFLSELILEKINVNKNTLLLSALPFQGRFREYLEKNPVFDVKNSPNAMGAVNEYLSLYQNTERSLHPTHSVVAIGPKSHYYIAEHHLDPTPFGIHSPYYKLIENNAKILMFGADLNYLTFIHVIEDMLGIYFLLNPYLKKSYFMKVIDNIGEAHIVETYCHDPFKSIRRNVNNLIPYFIKYNAIESYKIGESAISILDVNRVVYAYYKALLNGMSIYGRFYLSDDRKNKILERAYHHDSSFYGLGLHRPPYGGGCGK
jgi:aminoglycoside 3-N-acetyltransferase